MRGNDLVSLTPFKEYLLLTIFGFGSFVFTLLAFKPPMNIWKEPITPRQLRVTRAVCYALSAFMFGWGVWHLAS